MRRRGGVVTAAVVTALSAAAVLVGLWAMPSQAATPVVRPGSYLVIRGKGFAPRALITVARKGHVGRLYVHADSHGNAAAQVRAPLTVGRYTFVLVGRPAHVGTATPPEFHGRGDHQVVEVLVPRLVPAPVIVRTPPPRHHPGSGHGSTPGSGVGGESSGHPHPGGGGVAAESTAAHHPDGGGGIASTGLDVLALVGAALGAVAAGFGFLLASRRRRAALRHD